MPLSRCLAQLPWDRSSMQTSILPLGKPQTDRRDLSQILWGGDDLLSSLSHAAELYLSSSEMKNTHWMLITLLLLLLMTSLGNLYMLFLPLESSFVQLEWELFLHHLVTDPRSHTFPHIHCFPQHI